MCDCGRSGCPFCGHESDPVYFIPYWVDEIVRSFDIGPIAVACMIQEEYAAL